MHRRLLLVPILGVVGFAACGPSSKPAATTTTDSVEGGDPPANRLPWEAALTVGARFTLMPEMDDDGMGPLVIEVTAVEDAGGERIYALAWNDGEGSGPSRMIVRGDQVLLGEAAAEDMQPPWNDQTSGAYCYGEDFSNPDGCEDICDASLCLDQDGFVSAFGLYTPGYYSYSRE